ncbi:hypothetical protein [Crassaminicella profunda]|uniref:hypothetical protein n=1 Tax=Crassaminicella profunda TaxID=1286698 RepID=UPI001CA64553|nr:hypothetical protein [Crassaminicella profunda]QZY56650.1 hypothetical protein K7H06_06945 [Crassaminicella profunda]
MSGQTYYGLRYFVIPTEQESLMKNPNKVEVINNFVYGTKQNFKKLPLGKRNGILYFIREIKKGVYLFKFGKQKLLTKHNPTEEDINDNVEEDNYPYVYIIMDTNYQIILIERNTSIFKDVNEVKAKFQKFVEVHIIKEGYYFKVEEITYENKFWKYIENSKEIYSLTLKLNSPNLFGGRLKANKILKFLSKKYNNNQMQFKLISDKGQLLITKDNINDFIKYIVGGGGSWELKSYFDGKRQIIKSNNEKNVKTVTINENVEENNDKVNEIIKGKVISLEEIMLRKSKPIKKNRRKKDEDKDD